MFNSRMRSSREAGRLALAALLKWIQRPSGKARLSRLASRRSELRFCALERQGYGGTGRKRVIAQASEGAG
jgi:hypothetical protein